MNNEERGLVPYGQGRAVGFPDRQWGPPRGGEEPIPGWFPKEEPIEGEVVEPGEEFGRMPPAEEQPWRKEAERRGERAGREAIAEENLIDELRSEALSLGATPEQVARLTTVEQLRAFIRRLEHEGLSGERAQWRFGEEKAKAGRESLGRVGGRIKKTLLPGRGRTDIYFPGAGMRKLTSPGHARLPDIGAPLRAGLPLGGLRKASEFRGQMPIPTGDISPLKMKFGMAKETVMIPGLSQAENLAFQEIHANGDVDSPTHVASELMELGISKTEAIKAISGLLAKRLVETVKDRNFPGEPVLQITEGRR